MMPRTPRPFAFVLAGVFLWFLALMPSAMVWAQSGQPPGNQPQGNPPQGNPPQGNQPRQTPPDSAAMGIFREAFELTKTAKEDAVFTQIIDMCQRGLEQDPNEAESRYGKSLLAWAYNRRGETKANAGQEVEAMADFEESIKHDNTRWNSWHNRGVSHGLAGDYDAALADFNRVIQLKPDHAKAYYNRGEVRFKKDDLSGAISDYSRCLRLAPRDSLAYTSRGYAHYKQGNYRDAIRDYSQAIQTDRNNVEAYTLRGDAHADQANFSQALSDFQAAVRIQPNYGKAYQSAAWLRATCPVAQFRNVDSASRGAAKAIELDGDGDYRYLETLAAAQANANQFEEAQQTQSRAIEAAKATGEPQAVLDRAQERLELYEAGRPYRDVRPGQPQPR